MPTRSFDSYSFGVDIFDALKDRRMPLDARHAVFGWLVIIMVRLPCLGAGPPRHVYERESRIADSCVAVKVGFEKPFALFEYLCGTLPVR